MVQLHLLQHEQIDAVGLALFDQQMTGDLAEFGEIAGGGGIGGQDADAGAGIEHHQRLARLDERQRTGEAAGVDQRVVAGLLGG